MMRFLLPDFLYAALDPTACPDFLYAGLRNGHVCGFQ
jgi:hypothetical protein